MSLREPVAIPDLAELGRVHFVGIGGAGMRSVARLFAASGLRVSGSDNAAADVLAQLADEGIATTAGYAAEHVADADTVVVGSAIRADNPELVAARRDGRRVLHRSTALAAVMRRHAVGVAVGGTHGKTTTTAMIVHALLGAGADPSYALGGTFAATGAGARLGDGSVMVVEADESDGTFRQYPAGIVVVTNVEADHLDNWGTPQAYRDGFVQFVGGAHVSTVVADVDDPGVREVLDAAAARGPHADTISYGASPHATVRVSEIATTGTGSTARLDGPFGTLALRLAVPGHHNVHNAAAAVAAVAATGADPAAAATALATFAGTARRFQLVGESGGVRVIDDYAHHPTELRVNLAAARAALVADPPGRTVTPGRLVVCFQPHLFTRTRDFAAAFAEVLTAADVIFVLGIYPSREDPLPGVTGRLISDAVVRRRPDLGPAVHYVERAAGPVRDATAAVAHELRPGDLVLLAGAGDVTELGPALVARLAEGEGPR